MLPAPFIHQMQVLLGDESPAFFAALQDDPPVSIRKNPAKCPAADAWSFPGPLDPVPWHPQGYYLNKRPVFTLDPLLHAGAYYVQEASSMFLQEALRQCVDFSQPLRVLDLCAAPGGKSTLLAAMLSPGSLLVANEAIRQRTGALRENLEKWGYPNIAVTQADADDFAALPAWFQVVLTDAPCSGEGLFRKDPDAIGEWSPAQVELCAARQRRILAGAVAALAPNGILAYSTCTYNAREDDENARWLCSAFDLEPVRPALMSEWGIVETPGGGCQFFPHRLRGEGFYIALFRKKDDYTVRHTPAPAFKSLQPLPRKHHAEVNQWFRPDVEARFFQTPSGEVIALDKSLETDYLVLDKVLKNKWFGVDAGIFKGKDFVPAHGLALSIVVSPTLPAVALTREQALLFLKKETFDLPEGAPRQGWALTRFGGLNLGWLKALPNRWNNYLPADRRIRMDL